MNKFFCVAIILAGSNACLAQITEFAAPRGYDTGRYLGSRWPRCVETADLDQDGDRDVVALNWDWFSPSFVVFKNLGNGKLGLRTTYPHASSGDSIRLADMDGDGDVDVLIADAGQYGLGTSVSLYKNSGAGAFATRTAIATGGGPSGMEVADFDNDGDRDIVTANYGYFGNGSTLTLLRNNGSAQFTRTDFPGAGANKTVSAADLNGDGTKDLVIGTQDNGSQPTLIRTMLNNGAGTFTQGSTFASSFQSQSTYFRPIFALGDIDRDEDIDIVAASYADYPGQGGVPNAAYYTLLGDGNGGFSIGPYRQSGISGTYIASSLKLGDLNGDNWLDIVQVEWSDVQSGGLAVVPADGSGGFSPGSRYTSGVGLKDLTIADLDGDEVPEVITAAEFGFDVIVHTNLGNGSFWQPENFPVDWGHRYLDSADLDRNGFVDLISSAGSVQLLLNSNGVFSTPSTYLPPRAAVSAHANDLNGDGNLDIIWADRSGPLQSPLEARWMYGDGFGNFAGIQSMPIGLISYIIDIVTADINNDLKPDLIVADELGDRLWFAINDGFGGFQPAYAVSLSGHPAKQITTADFNQDGNLDVAICAETPYGFDHTVVVLVGFGNGTFQPPLIYNVDDSPESIVAADFNGDGRVDIATANAGYERDEETSVSILINNGNGTFQSERRYTAAVLGDPMQAHAADVDSDGDADLLISNYSNNDIAMVFNNCSGAFTSQQRYVLQTGLQEFAYVDFDNDGRKDIAALGNLTYPFRSVISLMRAVSGAAMLHPSAYFLEAGVIVFGGLASLQSSDNNYLATAPGPVFSTAQDPARLVATTVATTGTAAEIAIKIESRASTAGVRQIVEAWSYASGSWVTVDTVGNLPTGTAPDLVKRIVLTGNPDQYFSGSNELKVRVRFRTPGPVLSYPWRAQVDLIEWDIQE